MSYNQRETPVSCAAHAMRFHHGIDDQHCCRYSRNFAPSWSRTSTANLQLYVQPKANPTPAQLVHEQGKPVLHPCDRRIHSIFFLTAHSESTRFLRAMDGKVLLLSPALPTSMGDRSSMDSSFSSNSTSFSTPVAMRP